MTGTLALVRAALRRERVRIAVWIAGISLMVAISAESVRGLFPTQADLDKAAATSANPAILAFQGPRFALDTLGGQVAFQIGAPGLVIMALLAVLMTGRLTRAEEEAGRLELLRALPVGRNATIAAAGVVVGGMSAAVGAISALALVGLGLPVAGSIAFGLGYAAVGVFFCAATLVTAQVTDNHRLANGMAGTALGIAYVLRAIGDMRDGTLSWLSPLGWAQYAKPFAGEQWWPLLLAVAAAAGLAALAVRLQGHRDLGAGLVAARAGRAHATPRLRSPFALAVRLQRGSVIGWSAGAAATAAVYGGLASAIEGFIEDNPQIADFLAQAGGDLTDAYLATSARITALIGCGYAIQSMLRLRSEETNDRTEPVLGTPVSRPRYWAAHLAVAALGSLVVLLVAGLALGVSAAISVGDGSLAWRSTVGMVSYLPALLVMIAVAALLVGMLPKLSNLGWVALAVTFVVAMFGPILDLPKWLMRISPFENLALVPAQPISVVATTVLAVLAAVVLAASLAGYRRRDLFL